MCRTIQNELKALTLLAFRFPRGFRMPLTVNGNKVPFHHQFRLGFRGRFTWTQPWHSQLCHMFACSQYIGKQSNKLIHVLEYLQGGLELCVGAVNAVFFNICP